EPRLGKLGDERVKAPGRVLVGGNHSHRRARLSLDEIAQGAGQEEVCLPLARHLEDADRRALASGPRRWFGSERPEELPCKLCDGPRAAVRGGKTARCCTARSERGERGLPTCKARRGLLRLIPGERDARLLAEEL